MGDGITECRNHEACEGWLDTYQERASGLCEGCMRKRNEAEKSAEITRLRADLETVTRQRDAILTQARIWSGEAKSQKATVDQVGAILGGVPDWGAIAAGVEKLRADLAASREREARMQQDAERYRWLRSRANADSAERLLAMSWESELDELIDAALAEGAQG